MQYLYNEKRKKTAAHIWTGEDTACRMFSTGGLKAGKKEIHDDLDHRRVCLMCQNNFRKIESNAVLDCSDFHGERNGSTDRSALLHKPCLHGQEA